ncbi:rhodanese-like domain-containing protein [Elongatibacter sediminis]|uniref:Rhodanese-like domain-containing protein n=1 Tax=Elongatibacter sediminis TaxID=3119006 RepID=A0AAW9RME4_9GAMM
MIPSNPTPAPVSSRLCLLLILTLLTVTACAINNPPPERGTWIDVRTAAEYDDGHVSFAHHIPHQDILAGVRELGLARDEPILVYCGSGRRAGLARDTLLAAGYTDVENLGGIDDALERAGEDTAQAGESAGD